MTRAAAPALTPQVTIRAHCPACDWQEGQAFPLDAGLESYQPIVHRAGAHRCTERDLRRQRQLQAFLTTDDPRPHPIAAYARDAVLAAAAALHSARHLSDPDAGSRGRRQEAQELDRAARLSAARTATVKLDSFTRDEATEWAVLNRAAAILRREAGALLEPETQP